MLCQRLFFSKEDLSFAGTHQPTVGRTHFTLLKKSTVPDMMTIAVGDLIIVTEMLQACKKLLFTKKSTGLIIRQDIYVKILAVFYRHFIHRTTFRKLLNHKIVILWKSALEYNISAHCLS